MFCIMDKDISYMELALNEARLAADCGEVPVGAVVVMDGKVIASARNNREQTGDATGHAELLAIREACRVLGGWHLEKCTLYVTLEPCPMCTGAIINSRLGRVVYGAKDAKAGACGSVLDMRYYPLNHKPVIEGGVMAQQCADVLSGFFKNKRR